MTKSSTPDERANVDETQPRLEKQVQAADARVAATMGYQPALIHSAVSKTRFSCLESLRCGYDSVG